MKTEQLTNLVKKAQQGDRNALNDLIGAVYEDLYFYACQTVKDEDLAADVTQESCLEIIKTMNNLRQPEAFGVWARRITYHQAMKHFRHNQEVTPDENEDGETVLDRIVDESDSAQVEKALEDREFKQTMQQLLDNLPPEQRSALMMYYYEQLSVGQIAQIQGVSDGTVKSRLNYGRKAVKNQVEEYEKKHDVRLHSVAVLPLLAVLFRGQKKPMEQKAAAALLSAAKKSIFGVAAGIGVKVIAAIAAVAVVAGVAVGVTAAGNKDQNDDDERAEGNGQQQEQEQEEDTTAGHTHDFSVLCFDKDGHWYQCACEENGPATPHTIQDRACDCGYRLDSEGLKFSLVNDQYYKVTDIGECTDKIVVIPAYHEGLPVTRIGLSAFAHNTDIVAVMLPETITAIENRAFWGCENLKSINLPDSIWWIDIYAFWNCTSLTFIDLPDSIKTLYNYVLDGCTGLTELKIPEGVSALCEGALYKCSNLTKLTLPSTLTRIETKALMYCTSLTDIYFNGTVAQWKAVEKLSSQGWNEFSDWCTETADFTVHCTDGDVSRFDSY